MLLNLIVAITVCSFTAPPPYKVQELVEDISIPSGVGKAIQH